MPRHHAQVVRKPLSVRKSSSRPLDARLALRFPRLATAWGRLILRLAPTSRLRQAVVWRAAQNGMEAFNRRDIDAAVMPGSADFEMRPPQEFVEMGFEPCYRGPAGLGQYMSAWEDVFADLRVEPVELIDLGDRHRSLGRPPRARPVQWRAVHRADRDRLRAEGRHGDQRAGVPAPRPGPGSRGAAGVGAPRAGQDCPYCTVRKAPARKTSGSLIGETRRSSTRPTTIQ